MNLREPDISQNCIEDFVQIRETQNSASSLIGLAGQKFCGQQLPNYPGPSVLTSGDILIGFCFQNVFPLQMETLWISNSEVV